MELAIRGGKKTVTEPGGIGWKWVTEKEKEAVIRLLDEGTITIANGKGIIAEFEETFAKMIGTKYALAMTNGTATLHSAYFALGVGPGSEVIVPSYTWHATITPILHCAATPVFCDIDPRTLTADPEDIERKITPRTKVICVVHVWGNVANIERIVEIARKYGVKVVEDASHAHGATYKGKPVGSWGDIGCFSMQGSKPVSGGEAGVAVTNDPELFDRMLLLGHFGRIISDSKTGMFNHLGDMSLGTKYRPHPFAIAIANENLKRLGKLNELRRRNYEILNNELRDVEGIGVFDPLPDAVRAGFLEFKFRYDGDKLFGVSRDRFAEAVKAEGAPMSVDRYSNFNYTYGLLHLAPLFNTFDLRTVGGCFYDPTRDGGAPKIRYQPGSLPVTEEVCTRLIGFPAFADVSEKYVRQCAEAVKKVIENIGELKE